MFDYDSIKELAEQIGRPMKDLIALSPTNDPFYAGLPYRKRDAEWFAELWERFEFPHGVHLRRIHYVLISQGDEGEPVLKPDGKPYLNTVSDSALLNRASLSARYHDLIPLDALVDRRNEKPKFYAARPSSFGEPKPFLGVVNDIPRVWLPQIDILDCPTTPHYMVFGFSSQQDYVTEIFIEKSTQNDWLVPLCKRREVNLVVGLGEASEIQCRRLVERVQEHGVPTHIVYMSDFDPAGRSMPVAVARKLEYYIAKFELDVELSLNPLVLTEEQCLHYRLPRTPISEKERRRKKFEENFGAGATELDALEALHPGEMAKLLERELDEYLDTTFRTRVSSARWEYHHQAEKITKEVIAPFQEEIDDLTEDFEAVNEALQSLVEEAGVWEMRSGVLWKKIGKELLAQRPDLELEVPTPRLAAPTRAFTLFDSTRDYLTQIDAYREWQRR